MNIKDALEPYDTDPGGLFFSDVQVDTNSISAILINEVVPADPADDFYGGPGAAYLSTTLPLFRKAGLDVDSIDEILNLGIYITNAVKTPKTDSAIPREQIENSLPCLKKELALFSNVKVILLMGDVAKKAFNMLTKKATGKNAIPGISTYKIRNTELYYDGIRVMPSYIMTGQNLLIEKSKFEMAAEDISVMYKIINSV